MAKFGGYGWRRQQPDHRDWKFVPPDGLVLPPWVDQRAKGGEPPIFDQLQLGSCTANAGVGAIMRLMKKEMVYVVMLSRLDLYYETRIIEGDPADDNGATLRDTMKAAAGSGVCLESLWPYGDGGTFASPPAGVGTDAARRKLKSYLAVSDVASMKASLALGFPVVFGISVYDSFESDQVAATGVIPMPGPNEGYLGGHALCAVGYRSSMGGVVIFRNSWGSSWGDHGYGYIPYAYLSNPDLASDFWTPRLY